MEGSLGMAEESYLGPDLQWTEGVQEDGDSLEEGRLLLGPRPRRHRRFVVRRRFSLFRRS